MSNPPNQTGKHWKLSRKAKMNIGKGHKGIIPWNRGKTGIVFSRKHIENLSQSLKGRKLSETHKRKMSESMKSNKNPNWKEGITSLNIQIRNCFRYRQWVSDIFTRDNFTCVFCKARSGNGKAVYLVADHYPKKFSEIIKEYNIKTLEEALSCEELWNINNGRTLCRKCHKKRHKKKQ